MTCSTRTSSSDLTIALLTSSSLAGAGVNFRPHSDVALKADVQIQSTEDANNDNGFNLGAGYQF